MGERVELIDCGLRGKGAAKTRTYRTVPELFARGDEGREGQDALRGLELGIGPNVPAQPDALPGLELAEVRHGVRVGVVCAPSERARGSAQPPRGSAVCEVRWRHAQIRRVFVSFRTFPIGKLWAPRSTPVSVIID